MRLLEGIRLAWEQIATQRLKSLFTLLGVIVGVMFLVVVVSIVEGMDRYVRDTITERVTGVNTVTLSRYPMNSINTSTEQWRAWYRAPDLNYRDLDELRERVSLPAVIGAQSDRNGEIEAEGGLKAENINLVAASAEMFEIRNWVVERGRAFTRQEVEQGASVVVLGMSTADVLFGAVDPVGRTVRIAGRPYRVVGVLEDQGSFLFVSLDNLAVAPSHSPLGAYMTRPGRIEQIVLKAPDPSLTVPIREEVVEIMRQRRQLRPHQLDNFAAETAEASLGFWDRISSVLFVALPSFVGISLVVGGITIMNIMLVSVMERTREIGVRKAIGARRADILTQVLVESMTLSGVGAVVGVGVGVALTLLVGAISPLPAAVAPRWIALGVALGLVVGVVSGVYPASRAARLDPVDALRYE
ncbi:MAG: ABC transporter permease [Gemmatimonadetes bacterium]|nr:ABC transporter permease [Gemmatimonadota bacterium]